MSQLSTLLLRLEGPLQSWGYRSKFSSRDTGLEPTKSGVIGMLCCAIGRDRSTPPTDLAALKMHVRVDRQGRLLTDFHTAGGGTFRGSRAYFPPTSSGGKGKNPVITERQYLTDASFLVALEGESELLAALADGLQDPVWPLSLGRKSCAPSEPVFVALLSGSAEEALRSAPWHPRSERIRFTWEEASPSDDCETRNDVPLAWPDRLQRDYGQRFVRQEGETT